MAKGQLCPQCGEQTFQPPGRQSSDWVRTCTSCGAKGWLSFDTDTPPGRGRTCGFCDEATLKTVASVGATRVDYCNGCDSVTFVLQ